MFFSFANYVQRICSVRSLLQRLRVRRTGVDARDDELLDYCCSLAGIAAGTPANAGLISIFQRNPSLRSVLVATSLFHLQLLDGLA